MSAGEATSYGPPQAGVAAVAESLKRSGLTAWPEQAATHIAAAYDPALGLDRSVCLRDVIEALRSVTSPLSAPNEDAPKLWLAADFIAERFGNDR